MTDLNVDHHKEYNWGYVVNRAQKLTADDDNNNKFIIFFFGQMKLPKL